MHPNQDEELLSKLDTKTLSWDYVGMMVSDAKPNLFWHPMISLLSLHTVHTAVWVDISELVLHDYFPFQNKYYLLLALCEMFQFIFKNIDRHFFIRKVFIALQQHGFHWTSDLGDSPKQLSQLITQSKWNPRENNVMCTQTLTIIVSDLSIFDIVKNIFVDFV